MTYAAPQLTLSTTATDTTTTLAVAGEVDLDTAGQLRQALLEGILATPRELLVDMSAVTFMDSTGLHALMTAKRRSDLAGVRLAIINPSRAVGRLLEVTSLTTVFHTQPSEEATVTTA